MNIRSWSPARQTALVGVLVFLTSVFLFGVAEAVIRVRQWMRWGSLQRIEDTYTVDPVTDLRVPVAGGSFGAIQINSRGFRGPEFAVPKPAKTLRIAFLGSSTTYCAEVSSYDVAWPSLVTDAVQKKWSHIQVDHVNAGVPGYTLRNSNRSLQLRVAPLEPDIIVIYEGHNDLTGNALDAALREGIVTAPTEQNMSWPARYSLFWYLVEKNLLIRSLSKIATQPEGKLQIGPGELVPPFERDLKELVVESTKVADLVVLVTFSTQLRRDQTPQQRLEAAKSSLFYMPYMPIDTLVDSYEQYNDAVRRVAAETGVLLVDGENSIPGDTGHFVDTVHFTDQGSMAMARRVSRVLTESPILAGIAEQLGTQSAE